MKSKSGYLVDDSFNKKTNQELNQFWAGFLIYTICYTLIVSGAVSSKLVYLQLLGLLIFIIPAVNLIRFKIENEYLKVVFIVYCAWLLFIVLRGFSLDSQYLFNTLVDGSDGVFAYFVPLVLLFPRNPGFLKKVNNVILILSITYVLCDIVFIKTLLTSESETGQTILEYFTKILAIPCGFILLNIIYYTDKQRNWALLGKLWVVFVIGLIFLLAAMRARRGLMFMSANIFLFTYLLYNYTTRMNLMFKFLPLLIVFYLSMYAINIFNDKRSGAFALIKDRLTEDTRTSVEDYFYIDMEKKDLVVGRGIEGGYYCPTGATEDGYRYVVETGYLQIILKGGVISLGLLLLITIPAIFKGLFYSRNVLSKAAAIWILYWMIALFPITVASFSLNYLLVWISIGICYSREIRYMPEESVKGYFGNKMLR
ncbi:MAG TPA: hypothetical protein VM101_12100 [Flavitalea sp.]|nr:hypothetical protein [Flavitalea sp.]